MNAIEVMIAAYVQCALWSSNDEATDSGGEPMDRNYGPEGIDEKSLDAMRADCEAFLSANEEDIDGRYDDAGHDLWLTRNRHGAGFWDGDWPSDAGKRLTDAAHKMGERDLYVGDDGKVYQWGSEP